MIIIWSPVRPNRKYHLTKTFLRRFLVISENEMRSKIDQRQNNAPQLIAAAAAATSAAFAILLLHFESIVPSHVAAWHFLCSHFFSLEKNQTTQKHYKERAAATSFFLSLSLSLSVLLWRHSIAESEHSRALIGREKKPAKTAANGVWTGEQRSGARESLWSN